MKMKKYLMTGIAALALCVGFTSCSHDLEQLSQEEIDELNAKKIVDNYNKAFIATFGQPAADQNWGFGPSATRTRAEEGEFTHAEQTLKWPTAQPEPDFRDSKEDDLPVLNMPTFTHTVADAVYARNVTNWDTQKIISIDENCNTVTSKDGQVIYVTGNTSYYSGVSNNGSLFIVTNGKTLKLGCVGHNMQIYLEENAILDVTEILDWQGVKASWSDHKFVFEKSQAAIYLNNGSKIIGGDVKFFDGCKVLNNGGTIEVTNLSVDKNSIIWNNGTIQNVTNLTVNNENATIYNAPGKTITAENIKMDNNSALLFNEGTVTATDKIEFYNDKAEIVNAGTLIAPSMDFKAGGKFLNTDAGTTTIYGTTQITNTNSSWVNDGDYTSGDFIITNAIKVFNNCKLTVRSGADMDESATGTFTFNGDTQNAFILNANNSIKTDHMYWGSNADLYMGAKSMLWVVYELNAVNYVKGNGAQGPKQDYAVIKAGSIVYDTNRAEHRWSINYYNNIYVDTENHFPQGHDDKLIDSDQPWYYYSTANKTVMFKHLGDACPFTWTIDPATYPCHHGYNPPTPPTPPPFTADLRIMAEDLSASEKSDYDFNDIVFDVQFSTATTPAKIRVKAAGGTLPLRIKVKGSASHDDPLYTGKDGNGWQEVHALWGKDTGIMINTNATTRVSQSKGYEANYDLDPIELDYDVEDAADAKDIIIEVLKSGQWLPMEAEVGMPAAKFACSPDHTWADERVSLSGNSNFEQWVQGLVGVWKWY